MSVRENLIKAKALIDTPEKWIKGELWNEEHTCFCAMGAIAEVACSRTQLISDTPEWKLLNKVAPFMGVHSYNDDPSTSHADIIALFDRAIEAAE